MITIAGFDQVTDLIGFERKCGSLKLLDHFASAKRVLAPFFLGTGVVGIVLGQFGKVVAFIGFGFHFFGQFFLLLFLVLSQWILILVQSGDQNMACANPLGLFEFVRVIVVEFLNLVVGNGDLRFKFSIQNRSANELFQLAFLELFHRHANGFDLSLEGFFVGEFGANFNKEFVAVFLGCGFVCIRGFGT